MSGNVTSLEVRLAGLTLANPVMLLSGCAGFGEELAMVEGFDFSRVGAICLKGTTLHPKEGNPPPRVAETPAGMLNAIGLQNPGARHVAEKILPGILHWPTRFIANIAGSTVDEYAEVARIFDDTGVAAIEINISCPNVKEGGVAFGADPVMAARVVAAVRQATSKPLITKLSPNVTDIRVIARATIEAGTDILSAVNTYLGMAIDWSSGRPILGNVQGGLSGPAIKPAALLQVWRVYEVARHCNVPIIGQGGITCTRDAVEFFLVGAAAIGIGTALFSSPLVAGEIVTGLRHHLEERGLDGPARLTGMLKV
ncbi:MAG: dihydroorotate dehydrogenase [Magnetococcales bacterium]|nr:dihydroorotate dehydrogenase [Magnetococcales bacterium]